MDGGAWQAAIYKVAENQTRLNDLAHMQDTFTPQSKVVSILIRHPQILQISDPLNWSFVPAYLLN